MRDKFTWYLTKNMNGRAVDANEIELHGVKFKF